MHLLLQFYGNVGVSWMLTVQFRLPVFLQEQGFFLPLTVFRQTTRVLALKFPQGSLKAKSLHMALPSVSLSETQLFINLEMSKGLSQDQSRTCHRGSPSFPDTFSMDFLDVTYLAAVSRDQESLFCFLFLSAHFPRDVISPGALSVIHTLLTPNKSSAYCLLLRLTAWNTWLSARSFLCLSVMMSLYGFLLESPQLSKCQLALWRYIVPPVIVWSAPQSFPAVYHNPLSLPFLCHLSSGYHSFFSPSSPLFGSELGSTGHLARARPLVFFAAYCLPVCLRQPSTFVFLPSILFSLPFLAEKLPELEW